jgi:hypothetical protein
MQNLSEPLDLNQLIPFWYTKDRRYLWFTKERIFWFLQEDFK